MSQHDLDRIPAKGGSMELLTIAEIAKRLNIPESTLRSWRDKFTDFIPTTGSGRKKRYKPEAVQVFKTIAELAAEQLTADDIAERLTIEFNRFIDIRSDNSSTTAAGVSVEVYGISKTLQRMSDTLEQLARQQSENQKLRDDLAALEQRIQQLEKPQKAPWYRFRK